MSEKQAHTKNKPRWLVHVIPFTECVTLLEDLLMLEGTIAPVVSFKIVDILIHTMVRSLFEADTDKTALTLYACLYEHAYSVDNIDISVFSLNGQDNLKIIIREFVMFLETHLYPYRHLSDQNGPIQLMLYRVIKDDKIEILVIGENDGF